MIVRKIILVTVYRIGCIVIHFPIINEFDSGKPIAIHIVIRRALYIVLATYKIPIKITQVHIVNLIPGKKSKVRPEFRNLNRFGFAIIILDHFFLVILGHISPIFVTSFVMLLTAVHTRENSTKFFFIFSN